MPLTVATSSLQTDRIRTWVAFSHNNEVAAVRHAVITCRKSGFGGLQVACWPLVHKFTGSNPAEAVGFFRAKKNPQHAFLRKGSKAVCPMP